MRSLEEVNPENMKKEQGKDPILKIVGQWVSTNWRQNDEEIRGKPKELHAYKNLMGHLKVNERGILIIPGKDQDRVLVPLALRSAAFHGVHSHRTAGHFGQQATVERAKKMFYWPGMVGWLQQEVRLCNICLAKQTRIDTKQAEYVPRRHSYLGERLYVDLIGPLPETNRGYKYVLTTLC